MRDSLAVSEVLVSFNLLRVVCDNLGMGLTTRKSEKKTDPIMGMEIE